MKIDPFRSVAKELKFLSSNIRGIIGSGHPVLDTVSKYYTQAEGKHIRPMLVLLMSQATALIPRPASSPFPPQPEHLLNDAITPDATILADENPSATTLSTLDPNDDNTSIIDDILPSQRRLAEISELIHTASLLHDDVIDNSTSRRGQASVNIAFGNKMAVLAGDFLLGRASVALARLRNPEVTELLATVIANLIEGEFMQLRNTPSAENRAAALTSDSATLEYYLQKTYLKSASLISKSVRAAALLGGCERGVVEAAYSYGKNLGLAFQLVDDMLDFTAADDAQLGKPAGADLELGLATAPLLFAWRERPELGELVERRFEGEGDALKVRIPESVRCRGGANSTTGTRDSVTKQRARADSWAGARVCGYGGGSDRRLSRQRREERTVGNVYQSHVEEEVSGWRLHGSMTVKSVCRICLVS